MLVELILKKRAGTLYLKHDWEIHKYIGTGTGRGNSNYLLLEAGKLTESSQVSSNRC